MDIDMETFPADIQWVDPSELLLEEINGGVDFLILLVSFYLNILDYCNPRELSVPKVFVILQFEYQLLLGFQIIQQDKPGNIASFCSFQEMHDLVFYTMHRASHGIQFSLMSVISERIERTI
jgi:hypothetical protein